MVNQLLEARNWQIFLLIFGLPLLSIVLDIHPMISFYSFLLSGFFYFSWIYAIGYGLSQKLPKGFSLNIQRFRILFFIPILYIIILFNFIEPIFFQWLNPEEHLGLFLVLIFLHIFSGLCIMHSFWFAAKIIRTLELNRHAKFTEFRIDFILFIYYPIGIWLLQPRINKIVQRPE